MARIAKKSLSSLGARVGVYRPKSIGQSMHDFVEHRPGHISQVEAKQAWRSYVPAWYADPARRYAVTFRDGAFNQWLFPPKIKG